MPKEDLPLRLRARRDTVSDVKISGWHLAAIALVLLAATLLLEMAMRGDL